uniref:Uncharacterized protein n=1 Tax=Acrobeloides nanus TaxID=290746 RepID=A0A914EMU5_9BILA
MLVFAFILFITVTSSCSHHHDHHHHHSHEKVYSHPCPSELEEEPRIVNGEKVYHVPCSGKNRGQEDYVKIDERILKDPLIRYGRSISEVEHQRKVISPKFQILKKLLI